MKQQVDKYTVMANSSKTVLLHRSGRGWVKVWMIII